MSITITLPDSFEIENYTGLQAFLTDHLELPQSVVEQLPTLIRLAEARLARKLTTPDQETTATLATVAGEQTVLLPSDYLQGRQLVIEGDGGYPLQQNSLDVVEVYNHSGKPVVFATHGNRIVFGPVPDGVHTFTLRYKAKLPSLTLNTATNWLLTGHPDAYVYMCAAVINLHLENKEAAGTYLAFAEGVIDEINAQGNRHRRVGGTRLRSPVVV